MVSDIATSSCFCSRPQKSLFPKLNLVEAQKDFFFPYYFSQQAEENIISFLTNIHHKKLYNQCKLSGYFGNFSSTQAASRKEKNQE